MRKMLIAVSMLVLGGYAQAEMAGPVWTCQVEASQLEGHGFSFIVSGTTLKGEGKVSCSSFKGTISAPVNVKVEAGGVGLVVGVVKAQNVDLIGVGVGLKDPNEIFGKYPGVRGTAALVGGEASLSLNFGANEHGVALGVNLISSSIASGFRVGAALEGWTLKLSPVDNGGPWTPEPVEPPAPTPAH
ncbi:MAG: hypothetical protein KDD35_07770 [Bdellovibrionales bacterium]|nr:hypothetical protein [Bdellovibrionales bacterium]